MQDENQTQLNLRPKVNYKYSNLNCAGLFLAMVSELPNFEDFIKDKHYQVFMHCWKHKWFGGSILMPVACEGNVRKKHNSLKKDLLMLSEYCTTKRYFEMTEVMANDIEGRDDYFYDIFLLYVPVQNQNEAHAQKLFEQETAIGFKQLKRHLTGYARIIGYELTKHGKILNFVEEGMYIRGSREGYCRNISAIDGLVTLGFFHNDLLRGKGCIFNRETNGEYIAYEGWFEGNLCL